MKRKLIVTITEKGEKTVDIKFDWKPSLDMRNGREEDNSRVLLECFERIGKALGQSKDTEELQNETEDTNKL